MDLQAFHRFRQGDLAQLLQLGIVSQDSSLELIQGHILNGNPASERERSTIEAIAAQLRSQLGSEFVVLQGEPVPVDDYNVPRPSLTVVRQDSQEVVLAIQVAHTNLRLARLEKAQALGRAGIQEYWLVSLPERMLIVHRAPHAAGYTAVQRLPVGPVEITPIGLPSAKFSVSTLVEPELRLRAG